MTKNVHDQIQNFLGEDDLASAIDLIEAFDRSFANQKRGELNHWERKDRSGALSNDENARSRNRIRLDISDFIARHKIEPEAVSHTTIGKTPIFQDSFLELLESYLRANPNQNYIEMKLDILSLEYLRGLIARLDVVQRQLEPGNSYHLIKALDELHIILEDLKLVLVRSGNKDSEPYDMLQSVEDHYNGVRSLLVRLSNDDFQLNIGISKLKRAIGRMSVKMREKEDIAVRFSLN